MTMTGTTSGGNSSIRKSTLNFNGATTQTVTYTGTQFEGADINVLSGTTLQLLSNIPISKATTASSTGVTFTVQSGATLDCNGFNIIGTDAFTLASGGTIRITDADGITTSGATGNIRASGTRTFNGTATYWYAGNSTQTTGNALPTGSTAKNIIIDNTNGVTLTQATNISSAGSLEIRTGTFTETATAYMIAANGNTTPLTMGLNTTYNIAVLTSSLSGNTALPQMQGTYTLANSTIQLNGTGDQQLRGGKDYRNIIFKNNFYGY
jgi:hypothetical protein